MAQKKVHKKEKPRAKQKTPQEKKARDMRKSGLSLREISENLNIPRARVEILVKGVEAPARVPDSQIEQGKKAIADKEAKAKEKATNAAARPAKREANAAASDPKKKATSKKK